MKDIDKILAFLGVIVFELGIVIGLCWTITSTHTAFALGHVEFDIVSDKLAFDAPGIAVQAGAKFAMNARQQDPEDEWVDEEWYVDEVYVGELYSSDGFMQAGIRDGVDSATETWYSSNRARHKDTDQWSLDDEGYYRTASGYYVVASNDYEYGTVINTSKGQAQVLDDGTYSGNCDFYVGW